MPEKITYPIRPSFTGSNRNLFSISVTGVDTGYFLHRYTDFGHTNLGVPKFNPY